VPDAFQRTDYKGFLEEVVRASNSGSISARRPASHRAQAIRHQGECLALAKNEANWRHFGEDRVRQKQLDIQNWSRDALEVDLRTRGPGWHGRRRRCRRQEAPRWWPGHQKLGGHHHPGRRRRFLRRCAKATRLEKWLSELEKVMWDLKERKWF
jgi:hypothetical protein